MTPSGRKVFPVRRVVDAVWRRFEELPSVWMEGEITNLSRRGDRTFFTLVDVDHDDPTQLDAWMYTTVFDRLATTPADGVLVHAYGSVEFWRRRSAVRARVERIEPAGEGLLLAHIAKVRARLQAEGLTADERKRRIPFLPRRVGLVTARDGAARGDFITNATRRFPALDLIVVTARVQGSGAPGDIVAAIRRLDTQPDVDVIVLARGGGSLEDLMAFNDETVCRAVAASATPVVSAVGHEADITLCDLVADLRVSTPTKAAEAVVPDAAALVDRLGRLEERSLRALRTGAAMARDGVRDRARRLATALRSGGAIAAARVDALDHLLVPSLVRVRAGAAERVATGDRRLVRAIDDVAAGSRRRLDHLGELIDLLSPGRTVARGYAIVRDSAGVVVGRLDDIAIGADLDLELRDGRVGVTVVTTNPAEAR